MNIISYTIDWEKEHLEIKLINLIGSNNYKRVETTNGIKISVKFETNAEMENFKNSVNNKIPNLYK